MFGEHASFILPSYGITAIALVLSVIWIRSIYSKRQRELQKLEEQLGSRRGSTSGVSDG